MDDNGYWVKLDGNTLRIDPRSLVKVKNIVGYAIVWPYLDHGAVKVRCFLPGSGT